MKSISDKVVEKNETQFCIQITYCRKWFCLWDNVEK